MSGAGRGVARFVAGVVVALTVTGQAAAASLTSPPSLAALAESRIGIAAALADQAALCSSRRDTRHFAFAGCIDWHSSVHGVWALTAYRRATGDDRFDALVGAILDPGTLAEERAFVAARPGFEMPYGRAWFLRLAIEQGKLAPRADLIAMADEIALTLRDRFRRMGTIDPLAGSYDSSTWALINLIDYARFRGDAAFEREIVGWVETDYLAGAPRCPYEVERGHFMAVCTNWAALAARVMERDAYGVWLDGFIRANGLPKPVRRPINAHHFGLNFSRAWGLWDMYAASGREDIADVYVAHVRAGFEPASNWRGDYRRVGHWVAQFGMYAIQPLFGPEAGRP